MNIDDLKKQVFEQTDLSVSGIIDDLHAKGLLMVWNEDMDAAPRDVECLFLMDAAFDVNFSHDPRYFIYKNHNFVQILWGIS